MMMGGLFGIRSHLVGFGMSVVPLSAWFLVSEMGLRE